MRHALGLDLSTAAGYCFGAPDKTPLTGTVMLPRTGRDVGRFLLAYQDWLIQMLDYSDPALVGFEAPFLNKEKLSLDTSRKLIGLCNITELECSRRQISCVEGHIQSARKFLTGRGDAPPGVRIDCARAYGVMASNEHEADAFAIWAFCLSNQVPDLMARYALGLLGARRR